jgi:predicted ATPase
MPRFVVTGAPGTGKTRLIEILGQWFATVTEPARELIAEHEARTGEASFDDHPELFVDLLIVRSIDRYESVDATQVVFFDRGLPDCAAYASVYGIDPEPALDEAAAYRYDEPVFICPAWEDIYTIDSMRRATFSQISEFDIALRSAYERLGYEMVELPRTPPERRAALVIERIE